MGLILEDGNGSGRSASVNTHNMLNTNSVNFTNEHFVNHTDGEAYTVGFSQTPTGAGDCFGYITNTSDTDLIISTLMFYAASDETIHIKLGDSGTAVGGTNVTAVNRNAGSGATADATIQGGADITGLSGGSTVANIFVKGAQTSHKIEILSSLIIPKNKTVSFYAVAGAIAVVVGASAYFHDHE